MNGQQIMKNIAAQKGTKDLIIEILTENWPLSAKEIANGVQKNYPGNITYQAIHKSLGELEGELVISKTDGKYNLNIEWVMDNKKKFEDIESQLTKTSKVENKTTILKHESYHEFGRALLQVFANEMEKGTVRDACSFQKHLWWTFVLQKDEYYWFKKSGESKSKIACTGDSLIDQWVSTVYKLAGHEVKLGVDYKSSCDIVVSGDRVYQIYFPEKLRQLMAKTCSQTKGPLDIFKNDYHQIMYAKTGTTKTVIIRDKDLADHFRSEIKAVWEATV